MRKIFKTPKIKTNQFGQINILNKTPNDFKYLIGLSIDNIILFENGTEELSINNIILPRHYFLFVGNKDGEPQYKPYEFNPYRIVISTYKNIIINIDSIG
mgnify:CR=1 FL=1